MHQTLNSPDLCEHFVTVGDRNIFVTEVGEGPAVIMLHGGGPGASGMSNYSKNVAALAKRFRVIVPDMPGYGRSTKKLDHSDIWADLAKSLIGLMDAMDIEKASVVGNSLGGGAALRMALDHPERINRLVLMGPGGINTMEGDGPSEGLRALIGYYMGDGPSREKMAHFLRNYLVADAALVSEEMIEARYQSSIDPEVVADPPLQIPANPAALANLNLSAHPKIAEIKTPVLTLWGDADKVNMPSGGRWLQENLQNCDLYLFAGIGHWVQWERADAFNASCVAFLSEGQDS